MQYIDLSLIATIFEQLSSPKIKGYFMRLQSKVNALKQSEWNEYYEVYFAALDAVVFSIQSEGILSNACYQKITSLKTDAQRILREKFAIEIGTPTGQDYSFLKALDYLGIVSWYENEGKMTFFKSPTLVTPLFRYISNMDSRSLKEHMKSIMNTRQPDMTDEIINDAVDNGIYYVNDFISKFRDIWFKHIKKVLRIDATTALERVASVELLPTSTEFYFAGIKYYKHRFPKGIPTHFTFSTTSGIIMPEEHYGARYFAEVLPVPELAHRVAKNPIRENYFEIVRQDQMNKPRAYYFEFKRTSNTLRRTYSELRNVDPKMAEKYVEDAIRILKEYLQLPSFSLIQVAEFPEEFNYLTLGNSRSMLLSMRDRSQRIAHGLWVKPQNAVLLKAFSDVTREDLVRALVGGVSGAISGALLENLVVSFSVAFAPLIFFGVQKVRGAKQARDAVFDIGNRINKRRMEIQIVKDFGRKPYVEPETFVRKLLA